MSDAVTIRLPEGKPAGIWLLSDIHRGAAQHDATLYHRHKIRARKQGLRLLVLGDEGDFVGVGDKVMAAGAIWEQADDPQDQLEKIKADLEGFDVDAVVEGNHELRIWRKTGLTISQMMADHWKARLLRDGGWVQYKFGSKGPAYLFYIHHGEGPRMNPKTFFSRIRSRYIGADAYIGGHTHATGAWPIKQNHRGEDRVVWDIRAGTYLKGARYEERYPLGEQVKTGSVVLRLNPREKEIHPEFWLD